MNKDSSTSLPSKKKETSFLVTEINTVAFLT